jgi:hypothetical protein
MAALLHGVGALADRGVGVRTLVVLRLVDVGHFKILRNISAAQRKLLRRVGTMCSNTCSGARRIRENQPMFADDARMFATTSTHETIVRAIFIEISKNNTVRA